MILIKDRIVVCAPKKKKRGYEFIANYKDTGKNVFYSKSVNGKCRGIVGYVTNDLTYEYEKKLSKHLTAEVRKKINFLVETVYGNKIVIPERVKSHLKVNQIN